MLYLYAIVDAARDAPPGVRGLEDAPLRRVEGRGVAAIVSEHAHLVVEPTNEAIVRHAEIVERLAADAHAVVPARFGRTFDDESSLIRRLDERAAELANALGEVRGCVELGLRVLARADGVRVAAATGGDVPSGTTYMNALLERRTETERRADAIDGPLARLSKRSQRDVTGTPRLLFSAAYLVPTQRTGAFREQVERLQRDHPDLSLVCTGPWPPYSFVTTASPDG